MIFHQRLLTSSMSSYLWRGRTASRAASRVSFVKFIHGWKRIRSHSIRSQMNSFSGSSFSTPSFVSDPGSQQLASLSVNTRGRISPLTLSTTTLDAQQDPVCAPFKSPRTKIKPPGTLVNILFTGLKYYAEVFLLFNFSLFFRNTTSAQSP